MRANPPAKKVVVEGFAQGQYMLFTGDKNTIVIDMITQEGKIISIHSTNLTGMKKGLHFSAPVRDWQHWVDFGRLINHPFLNP